MKIIQVQLSKIEPVCQEVDQELLESLRQRGQLFPLKVNVTETGYQVVDGKKRLAAMQQLAIETNSFLVVQVVLNFQQRSMDAGYWGPRNQH